MLQSKRSKINVFFVVIIFYSCQQGLNENEEKNSKLMLRKGLQYLDEDTPTPHYDSAVFYLEKAAEQNNIDAHRILAEQYMFGYKVDADTLKAQAHVKAAISSGDSLIYNVLAKYYYPRDIDRAIDFLKKGDNKYAKYELAQLLIAGYAFGQPDITYKSKIDKREGIKHLIKSADAGNFYAQQSLVHYYFNGIKDILNSDTSRGNQYYKQALSNPDIKSIEGAADELEILRNEFKINQPENKSGL